MKHISVLIALLLTAVLLLSACDKDGQGTVNTGSGETATSAASSESAAGGTSSQSGVVIPSQIDISIPETSGSSSAVNSSSAATSSKKPGKTSSTSPVTPAKPESIKPPVSSQTTSSAPEVKPVIPELTFSDRYLDYQSLTAAQKTMYKNLFDAIVRLDRTVFKVGKGTRRDGVIALTALRGDYPQIFWLPASAYGIAVSQGEVYFSFSGDGYDYTVKDADALKSEYEKMMTAVSKAHSECIKSGMSDYEKELALHDWLCKKVTYDNTPSEAEQSWSAYGALIKGSAVCEGYCRAFQLMLYGEKIDCRLVYGTADGGKEEHSWNLVRIGGTWYHIDVTWDDSQANEQGYHHTYFNLPDTWISRDHQASAALTGSTSAESTLFNFSLPTCTSTTANYHVKNGTWIAREEDFSATVVKSYTKTGMQEFFYAANPDLTASDFNALVQKYHFLGDIAKKLGKKTVTYVYSVAVDQPAIYLTIK